MHSFDLASWERKEAYDFFSQTSNPFYMVTFRQDVTDLYNYTKRNGLSFYYGMIWACTKAIHETEPFHLTIRDGLPVRLDSRNPSFTDLKPGAEQFHIVTMDMKTEIADFCREAARISREQTVFLDTSKETDELIFFSCLPWIDLTALTNERDLRDPHARDDSIPRIAWGKYTEENGRKILGLSIEVNHRLIDGLHIGRFAQCLSDCIRALP